MAAAESVQQRVDAYLAAGDGAQGTELVQTVKSTVFGLEDFSVFATRDLPSILELDEKSPTFYSDFSADLWEVCLVLEALCPCENVKRLSELVIRKANIADLFSAWKAATSALLSYESPSLGFVEKIFAVEEKPLQLLDTMKTACSYCLSRLLSDLSPSEVQSFVTEQADDFLSLLCKGMDEAYKFLRTEEFHSMLHSLRSRVDVLRGDPKHALSTLKAGTVLLGLLADSDAMDRNQSESVGVVMGLGQDFHALLITWRSWFVTIFKPTESSDLHNYSAKGVAVLANLSIQESVHRHLHLPCAFSDLYRLQVYVPIANLVFYTHPDVAISLLSHSFTHFSGKFRSIKSPFLLVPEGRQSTPQFLKEMLDLLGRTDDPARHQAVKSLFQSFISFFTDAHRYILLRKLLREYSNDYALGMLVDMYAEERKSVLLFAEPKRVLEVVKLCFRKKPVSDHPHTVRSAANLYSAQLPALSQTTVKKVRSKFIDPLHTLLTRALDSNRSLTAVEAAVTALAQAISLSQELVDNK